MSRASHIPKRCPDHKCAFVKGMCPKCRKEFLDAVTAYREASK